MKQEVATDDIFRMLRATKRRVCYPRINRDKKEMEFYEVDDLAGLEKASYAILEPHPSANRVETEAIDLVIVPGIIFDEKGNRIGYGKGFYDRTLMHVRAKKIGLAFAFQQTTKVPCDPWDQAVDALVTEDGIQEFVTNHD